MLRRYNINVEPNGGNPALGRSGSYKPGEIEAIIDLVEKVSAPDFPSSRVVQPLGSTATQGAEIPTSGAGRPDAAN